jgi:hypothetical protein
MNIKRAFIFLVIAVAFASCQTKCTAEADVLTVKLDNFTGMQERGARWTEMRGFLWNHWVEKKYASLFLTTVSKEGRTTHAEYRYRASPRQRAHAQSDLLARPNQVSRARDPKVGRRI